MVLKTIFKSSHEASSPPPEPAQPEPTGPVHYGDRVGAICDSTESTVRLFGYGVYLGQVHNDVLGGPNPKIQLDDGSIVWGYQCWWGHEAKIKRTIGKKHVVVVPSPEPKHG